MTEAQDDPFEVRVQARPLPDYIQRRRELARLEYARHAAILQPRIDGHLEVYGLVLDALDSAHRHIADNTNLTLDGDTRPAAAWTVAGRCIGLARAMLTLLAAGFTAEAAAEARTLHEAVRLLGVLADEDEPDLLRRWLEDDGNRWVRPRATRAASDRQRERVVAKLPDALAEARARGDTRDAAQLDEAIRSGGLEGDNLLAGLSLRIYDVMSWIGHSRRRGIQDAVSVSLREMATGPHPDPLVRAEYVEWAGAILVEVTQLVGDALGRFFGPGWYIQQIVPLVDKIGELGTAAPIDARTRASVARR
jgi:hypothetical protein